MSSTAAVTGGRLRLPDGQRRVPVTVKLSQAGLAEARAFAAAETGGNVSRWIRKVIAEAANRRRDTTP